MSTRRTPPDVTVVGAGPAGLMAAAVVAEAGKRVLLLDHAGRPGGQIWRHRAESSLPRSARALLARVRRAGVIVTPTAGVVDVVSAQELVVDFAGRIAPVATGALVLAIGARERFLPFPGWTLPGVAGVGGLQALLKGGTDFHGKRVAIGGSGPLLLAVAATMARAGARLVFVGEQLGRSTLARFARHAFANPARLAAAARYRWAFASTPYETESWVTRAIGTERIEAVTVSRRGRTADIECDWLGCAYGLVPTTDLARVAGCEVTPSGITVDSLQRTSVPGILAAGECTGVKGDAAAMLEGEIAGLVAAGDVAGASRARLQRGRDAGRRFGELMERVFTPRPELLSLASPTTVVCRCEDVAFGALDASWSQRQAKLWTRVGMGACQGAVCGPACATLFGWDDNASRAPIGAPECGAWSDALRQR